jgi:hypothetical protein
MILIGLSSVVESNWKADGHDHVPCVGLDRRKFVATPAVSILRCPGFLEVVIATTSIHYMMREQHNMHCSVRTYLMTGLPLAAAGAFAVLVSHPTTDVAQPVISSTQIQLATQSHTLDNVPPPWPLPNPGTHIGVPIKPTNTSTHLDPAPLPKPGGTHIGVPIKPTKDASTVGAGLWI